MLPQCAVLYPGANSRAELLPLPRANARTALRAVARGQNLQTL